MMPALDRRRRHLALLGAVAFVMVTGNLVMAAPGDLDPTFDGDGRVTTHFNIGDEAHGVAIQADGKIVAGGFASISGVDFALARYNSDGSLDPTFDGDGKVTTDYGIGSSQVYGLAIQADGKIVAAGYGSSNVQDFFLARYKVCRVTSRRTSIPCT